MTVPRRKSQQQAKEQVDWTPKVETQTEATDLRDVLERVKSKPGIIGYIVRGPTSASVDMKDPSKMIDYAALSAEAMECGENLANTFDVGKIQWVVLEGKNLKILCVTKDEQQISVFMEKNVDHNGVYRELA